MRSLAATLFLCAIIYPAPAHGSWVSRTTGIHVGRHGVRFSEPGALKAVKKPAKKIIKEIARTEKRVEKEINRTDENLHRHAKSIGKAIEASARKTRDFADTNKEAIALTATVAVAGWAACADGCTFVSSLFLAGASGTTAILAEAKASDDTSDGNSTSGTAKNEEEQGDSTGTAQTQVCTPDKDTKKTNVAISRAFTELPPEVRIEVRLPISNSAPSTRTNLPTLPSATGNSTMTRSLRPDAERADVPTVMQPDERSPSRTESTGTNEWLSAVQPRVHRAGQTGATCAAHNIAFIDKSLVVPTEGIPTHGVAVMSRELNFPGGKIASHSWIQVVDDSGSVFIVGGMPGKDQSLEIRTGDFEYIPQRDERLDSYAGYENVRVLHIPPPPGVSPHEWNIHVILSAHKVQEEYSGKLGYRPLGGDRGQTSGNCHVVTRMVLNQAYEGLASQLNNFNPPGLNAAIDKPTVRECKTLISVP